MATIANEIARAKQLNNAKVSTFKGVTPRNVERNSLKTDDIFTIPADYVVLEQEVQNGTARKDASGRMVKPTAKYIFVEVERDSKPIIVAFYPTAFWKRRQLAELVPDPSDATKQVYMGNGTYASASGTASEFVQGYADLDEALKAMVGRKIKVTRNEILSMPYGATSVDESDLAKVQDSVLEMNFVEE